MWMPTTRLASVAPIRAFFRPILEGGTCWHESTSKIGTLQQKVDIELKDARVGWRLEGVKDDHPSSESASKMRTLRQKVDVELDDARVGWRMEKGSKMRTLRQKVCQKCNPLGRKSSSGMELSRPQGPLLPGGVKRCFFCCQIT